MHRVWTEQLVAHCEILVRSRQWLDWRSDVDFGGKAAEPGRYAFIAQAVRDGKSASVDSFAATRVTGVSWDQNSGKAFLELAGGKPILLETVKRIAQ